MRLEGLCLCWGGAWTWGGGVTCEGCFGMDVGGAEGRRACGAWLVLVVVLWFEAGADGGGVDLLGGGFCCVFGVWLWLWWLGWCGGGAAGDMLMRLLRVSRYVLWESRGRNGRGVVLVVVMLL